MQTDANELPREDEPEARRTLAGALFPLLLDKPSFHFSDEAIILSSAIQVPREEVYDDDQLTMTDAEIAVPLDVVAGAVASLVLQGAEVSLATRAVLVTPGEAPLDLWRETVADCVDTLDEFLHRVLSARDDGPGRLPVARRPMRRSGRNGRRNGSQGSAARPTDGSSRGRSPSPGVTSKMDVETRIQRARIRYRLSSELARRVFLESEMKLDGESLTFLRPTRISTEKPDGMREDDLLLRFTLAGAVADLLYPHCMLRVEDGALVLHSGNGDPLKWKEVRALLERPRTANAGEKTQDGTGRRDSQSAARRRIGGLSVSDSARLLDWASEVLEIKPI